MAATLGIAIDDRSVRAGLAALSGRLRSRVLRGGTDAMARVVRRDAKRRGFGFTDRSFRLRKSIRVERSRQLRGTRRRPGRLVPTRLTAGGVGARQAFLVEAGHGGPSPAPGHSYLRAALRGSVSQQRGAAVAKIQATLPAAIMAAERQGRRSRLRRR